MNPGLAMSVAVSVERGARQGQEEAQEREEAEGRSFRRYSLLGQGGDL
jgi:hypothetical protein